MNKNETAYRTKTITVGTAIVRIHQPILNEQERQRQEEAVKSALMHYGKQLKN